MFEFLKRNRLILVYLIAYLAVMALSLVEIDKQYYQNEKRDIIRREYFQTGRMTEQARALESMMGLARQVLTGGNESEAEREAQLREIEAQLRDIVEGDSMFVRMAVYETPEPGATGAAAERKLIVEVSSPEKMRRFNNFSNSLLLRNFSGFADQSISDSMRANTQVGRLITHYTTPPGDSQIVELTNKWRWRCVIIVAVLTLLGWWLARSLVLPLQNVQNTLISSTPDKTRFVLNDRAHLEHLYNRIALDAVMARLHGRVREVIAERPGMTGWEMVEFSCGLFSEALAAKLAGCLELASDGPGTPHRTGRQALFGEIEDQWLEDELLAELIDEAMPRDGSHSAEFEIPSVPALRGPGVLYWLADPDRDGVAYLMALHLGSQGMRSQVNQQHKVLRRLVEVVEAGLQTLSLRNQLVVKERGRANISLSRNLGHDLTNIIATSKLEMMALERVLKGGEVPQDDKRRSILIESLEGMLRSTRFMQETVNLYRAYAFLQHPVLEPTDANELIGGTLELFQMSISSKVRVEQELDPTAPRCMIDPRLIKLALFNLFSNALEAIRKKDPDLNAPGWIRVRTATASDGGLSILIEDSGTGILTRAGRRARGREIEQIFDLGYTTEKLSGSQGEGLGLNWVRTIVEDLHGGLIRAGNLDRGGACFVLNFPPVDEANATEAGKARTLFGAAQ